MLVWLIVMIIGLTILGLLWCSWWGRETFAEWFPIVDFMDGLVESIRGCVENEGLGDFLWLVGYCLVIIIPVALLIFGTALSSDGFDNIMPLIFHVAGGVLAAVGWNQDGALEIILYVVAALLVLIGLITSMQGGFFSGLFGSILLQGSLILLPAALANFGLLLMIAIGIGIIVLVIKAFFSFLENADIIFFWRC